MTSVHSTRTMALARVATDRVMVLPLLVWMVTAGRRWGGGATAIDYTGQPGWLKSSRGAADTAGNAPNACGPVTPVHPAMPHRPAPATVLRALLAALCACGAASVFAADPAAFHTRVAQVIAEAGGSTEVASLATVALGLDTTEPEGLAGYLHARDIEMAEPGPELQQQVATALVAEWYAGEGRELTQLLVDAGLIEVPESLAGTATVSAVVVMAGGADGADPFALALGQAMAGAGGTAVGVEAVASDTGVAAACASQGLSAVGHVATPQGRVSLVWVLSGAARGYFGPAEDADGYYPSLLIEE